MPNLEEIISEIRMVHRQDRFAMKMQSRIDRSVEAFVRVNVFGFSPDLSDDDRKAITSKTNALVSSCRKGTASEEHHDISEFIAASDASRKVWDAIRSSRQRRLEKMAKQLPGFKEFVLPTPGLGAVGFAQIIAEAGDLSNYANPAKLWKRLGLAPYDGLAMSSWRRETWRPRALTSEEWVANPFKAERYAIVAQIAQWVFVKQGVGKDKSPNGEWAPNGHYGEIYFARRAHTAVTHRDWTDMHSMRDGLRYMMKRLIRDLWREWRRARKSVSPSRDLPSASSSVDGASAPSKAQASGPMASDHALPAPPNSDGATAPEPPTTLPLSPNSRMSAAPSSAPKRAKKQAA